MVRKSCLMRTMSNTVSCEPQSFRCAQSHLEIVDDGRNFLSADPAAATYRVISDQ